MASPAAGLNPFAARQNLTCCIVALSDERTWKEPTLCIRLLLLDGSQTELHAVKDAKTQFESLGVKGNTLPSQAYSLEISRSSIRPYKNSQRTGIQANFFVRLQWRVTLQRALCSIPPSLAADRTYCAPADLDHLPYDSVVNIAGRILSVSTLLSQPSHLQKRTLELQHGDFSISVTALGTMATLSWEAGQLVLLYGCIKREYNGLTTLETTRLAWRMMNPPWLADLSSADDAAPPRKALRRESLQPCPINILPPTPSDGVLHAVIATANPVTNRIFNETLWLDDARMRLPMTLQDATGVVRVTFWSQDWPASIDINELGALYTQCNTPAGEDNFLQAINANLQNPARWLLRPKRWARDDGSVETQWHVVSMDTLPPSSPPMLPRQTLPSLPLPPPSPTNTEQADEATDLANEDTALAGTGGFET